MASQKQRGSGDRIKPKGAWILRLAIHFFTLVFAILVYWLLGFFVRDIQSIRGPDFSEVLSRHVDTNLVARSEALDERIAAVTREIENQSATQRVLTDSSGNLQRTITQLIELQKLGIEKEVPFSETEQENFASSLDLFLENQRRYQELSQTEAQLLEQKQELVREKEQAQREIQRQHQPARAEYDALLAKHRLKLAFLQLAILLPLLAVAAFAIVKKRGSIYFPLFLAFGGATLIKVTIVVHQYFPTRYFKYILIVALLLAVGRLLIHFIRTIAFPKTQWLVKQYREAYERFLCPVCDYPVRMGPRRFLFWTRRTVNKMVVPSNQREQEEEYTCPSCGSTLFSECPSCHKIRHTLLPHCAHCGAEQVVETIGRTATP